MGVIAKTFPPPLPLSPTSTSFPEHVHSAPIPPPPPPPPVSPTHVLNPHLYAEWVRSHPRSVVGCRSTHLGWAVECTRGEGVRSPFSSCGEGRKRRDSPLVRAMLPRSSALWRGEGDKFRDRNSVQRWFPTKRFAIMSNRQKGAPKCDHPFLGSEGTFS